MNIIKKIKEYVRFRKYMKEVREQLTCNASDIYKEWNITYNYTNKQIDSNIVYFKYCFKSNLSSYKALLFFSDYKWRNRIIKEINNA